VAIRADVELGGTDQKFNLLVGRDIQREYGQEPQVIITMPILPGTDGVEKMSKSLDNYIGISDQPQDMFGKTMSIPDNLILDYFTLATDVSQADLQEIKREVGARPYDMKRRLALAIVTLYHDGDAAAQAEDEFLRRFKPAKGKDWTDQLPSDMPEASIRAAGPQVGVLALLTETGLAASRSEARRLVEQGGVVVDGLKITDWNSSIELAAPVVVKVGKLKFARVSRA